MTDSLKALVPLKAHSERVPEKNFRPLAGRPLFHWIFETLRAVPRISEIVVDTDSEEIGRAARDLFGATVLEREQHLRGDDVSMNLLIESQLARTDGGHFLQTHATNPLLTAATVERAIDAYFSPGSHDSLFTVNAWKKRFYRADGSPLNHDPEVLVRTQDLAPLYEENSNLYLFSRASFSHARHRIGKAPILLAMSPLEALDIDDEEDFRLVDYFMARRLQSNASAPA